MVLRKEHLYVLGLILVLAIAYFAQHTQNGQALHRQRDNLVEGCVRASARTAIIAAFTMDAARTRQATPGRANELAASRYFGYAAGIISTIPAPLGHRDDERLADVEQIENPRTKKITFRLTEEAKRLQAAGCQSAYPRT